MHQQSQHFSGIYPLRIAGSDRFIMHTMEVKLEKKNEFDKCMGKLEEGQEKVS